MATFSCCLRGKQESYFKCTECNIRQHLACLKMREVPGGLLEDVFFEFVCKNCSPQKIEEFTRKKLPWITVLVLTLYNLQEKSRGMSKKGYFHWRMHVCSFIDRHWNTLFGPQIKKKKNWQGTISGTLSHFSPRFFSSGLQVLNESGWWCLTHSLIPQLIIEVYERTGLKRNSNNKDDDDDDNDCQINKKIALMGNVSTPHETHTQNEKHNIYGSDHILKQETNYDNSDQNISGPCDSWSKEEICENSCMSSSDYDQNEAVHTDDCGTSLIKYIPNENMDDLDIILTNIGMEEHEMDLNFDFSFDEIEKGLSLKSESSSEDEDSFQSMGKKCDNDTNSNRTFPSSYKFKPLPSLFPVNKGEPEVSDDELSDSVSTKECNKMNIQDEVILMRRLEQILHYKNDVPAHIRRYYRKLCIRQENRHLNRKVFDLEESLHTKKQNEHTDHNFRPHYKKNPPGANTKILDRFQVSRDTVSSARQKCPSLFRSSLTGVEELSCFYSPFTGRKLKPYIWQDTDTKPLWIKLLDELDSRVNKNIPNWTPRKQYPIDYCYIQPQHIPIINELCNEHFYPGIDLTECLEYPDFTCVVLYKKLIVAFAIMVPDVSHNEAYISFIFTRPKWRRAGIAKFMLYHLIQTSFGRDITLHVSSQNTAMLLYQKFGFRIDSFEPHFYERYLPFSSTESRHAFFLRLHS